MSTKCKQKSGCKYSTFGNSDYKNSIIRIRVQYRTLVLVIVSPLLLLTNFFSFKTFALSFSFSPFKSRFLWTLRWMYRTFLSILLTKFSYNSAACDVNFVFITAFILYRPKHKEVKPSLHGWKWRHQRRQVDWNSLNGSDSKLNWNLRFLSAESNEPKILAMITTLNHRKHLLQYLCLVCS